MKTNVPGYMLTAFIEMVCHAEPQNKQLSSSIKTSPFPRED